MLFLKDSIRKANRLLQLVIAFVFFTISAMVAGQSLVINEIMSSNATAIPDEDGDFEDWIELYNGTDSPVNLFGFCLTDDPDLLNKWAFPDIELPSDAFLLIFASGKDRLTGPFLHTNFSIKMDGETILLSDSAGQIIDQFDPVGLMTDNSYGRKPDGTFNLVFFEGSTPGYSNNQQSLLDELPDNLSFSHPQGFYTGPFVLIIDNLQIDAEIRYTLNGSDPTMESLLYQDSLLIDDRAADSNCISMIPTNPETAPDAYRWRPPEGNVFKGTVITVRSFIDGQPASQIYRQSYFVDPEIHSKYKLPVISIITDSLNLFDYETGIYIPGLHHDLNPSWEWYYGTGNYHERGEAWEREANFTFFEPDGEPAFQQNVGIRIHGAGSRALSEKSLRIYARNRYGKNTIEYRFFPEKEVDVFRRIILRNSGQDFLTTMLTDALSHKVVEHLDLETISVRPSVVFINGEFWGIHNIRDRNDKYFLEYCCDADPEQIDYLEGGGSIVEGSNQDYSAMMQYIQNNDMSLDEHYQVVENQIDVGNYIDYIITKQYLGVYDWPGNNIEFWRHQVPGSRWRWILFDNDIGFTYWDFNSIQHATLEGGLEWPNPDWSTKLLRNLLKNETFRQKYLDRFVFHLLNTFNEERINLVLDSLLIHYEPVMEEHINRWQFPAKYTFWEYYINRIRMFAEKRPCIIVQHLIEHFEITDTTFAYGICTSNVIGEDPSPHSNAGLKVYPNPSSRLVNVEIQRKDDDPLLKISILDLYGRVIRDFLITPQPGKKTFEFQVTGITPGSYILLLLTEINIYTHKLIIQ
ncbi:MAG: CotH kinase family protein [Bacteroidales bacterium]